MSAALNGRLTKLEQTAGLRHSSNTCVRCGFRHVQPLTLDLARRIIGPISTMSPGLRASLDGNPPPRMCFCEPCCGNPGDRWFALRSHGIDVPLDAAW